MRTLLLDCNYFPVKIINWQKAMVLLVTSRAEVVDEYADRQIRSVSKSFKLPKVLRLYGSHRLSFHVKFTRMNVFYRDRFSCQYCHLQLPATDLTFDHVIPVSKGGKTSWDNVVSCCRECNSKKGSLTLLEAGFKLTKKPRRPKWTPELCLRLKDDDPVEWLNFFPKGLAA